MRLARRYRVHGRVQGVGFRFFTFEAARVENIQGWVRNLADGTVEVLAEGERESLERFESRIQAGPRGSRVEQLDVADEGASGRDGGFEIR